MTLEKKKTSIESGSISYIAITNYNLNTHHLSDKTKNTTPERKNIEYNHGISVHEEAM